MRIDALVGERLPVCGEIKDLQRLASDILIQPRAENQQRPEFLAMIDFAAVMLVQQALDRLRLEPFTKHAVLHQPLPRPRVELVAEPAADRHAKALFATCADGGGKRSAESG